MSRPAPAAPAGAPGVALVSASWGEPGGEAAFAARVLAGAASRLGPVDVFGPWPRGRRADGAFDPEGIGQAGPGRRWPSAPAGPDPKEVGRYRAVLVDGNDPEAVATAGALLPGVAVLGIGGERLDGMAAALELAPGDGRAPGRRPVGLHIPVHALAAERPHLELGGISDYTVVLSGRPPDSADPAHPDDEVAWLVARYPRRPVVVVENAVASVWRSRSCVRRFGVHTRMDLWRLMAHARTTVDLGPGPLFGRECVESVRYGVPVVVPAGSTAATLAAAGAGLAFSGPTGLLDAVGSLDEPATVARLRAAGAAIEHWFGEPAGLVARLSAALERPDEG